MEHYEDDDDTHFCIKCHVTIQGLDNYVRHRQSGCRSQDDKNEAVRVSPTTPTTVSYPEILNADAFFSSLELQSSSKINSRRAATLIDESKKFKKDDKRRKSQKMQPQMDVEDASCVKEKLHSLLPGVLELEDPTEHLCMPSLVGFPDIVTSAASKSTITNNRGKLSQSLTHMPNSIHENTSFPTKHEVESSLEGLIVSHVESKQTERKRHHDEPHRIDQVQHAWLEDTLLAELVANNEHKDLSRYEFEYSDDDMLEEDLEEHDSYSESEDGEDREGPPHGHTGGKWKPELEDLPQNMSQLQEDDLEAEDEHQEHPPPTYTGGKWRPSDVSQKLEVYETKPNIGQPPPGHTRGKWVPGAQADTHSGYWCSPCGRKLASRLVYNRHLLSDLHARRSVREINDVLYLPRNSHVTKKTSTRHRRLKDTTGSDGGKTIVRKREKEILSCEMCHARVRRMQMGKHLLSHYHCCAAGVNPRGPRARRFLLENMPNVVRQCPFQCSSCHFYCNTEETFLRHWRSDLHAKTIERIDGSFKCTPCDFWCDDNETMDNHLLSTNHRDVVLMMNGSVPIVVGRQTQFPCGTCNRRFRYNLQLRLHVRKTGHEESATATDAYQRRIKCNLCPQIVRSLVALQRHQLTCHNMKNNEQEDVEIVENIQSGPYFCSFCSMNFSTAKQAVLHRRTSSHKESVKVRKSSQNSLIVMTRECSHCEEKQRNLLEYKKHLLEHHPELCHRCPKCGQQFALSQDVTRHTRENKCSRVDKQFIEGKIIDKNWTCESCGFTTDSQAEFIFHEALHAGSVENSSGVNEEGEISSTSKTLTKYLCPVCKKAFTKVSLRNHIRSHTGERPFPCAKCSASFSRRSDLNAHQKECSGPVALGWSHEFGRKRSFACSECSDAFYTKHALRQHILRHAGKKYKCGLPGCPTVLRTASELKSHRSLVHDSTAVDRRYKCSDCSYAGKTKTQLRRHRSRHDNLKTESATAKLLKCPYEDCNFKTKLASHLQRHTRLHTGTKPYKCRHCSYASNNLENLRKHVLSTNLHPGKTIYECDVCIERGNSEPFKTNFAKELRAHLQQIHENAFPTSSHVNDYVLGIFRTRSDSN